MPEATEDEIVPLVFRPNRFLPKIDKRTPFERNFAVCLILLSAGFERLAFYSLAGNLTFFLDSKLIKWRFPHTIIAPLIFLGTSYLSALVFSWISDGRLGRAKTIIIGKCVFFKVISYYSKFFLYRFYNIYDWLYIHDIICR
jgi:hypothetical protein